MIRNCKIDMSPLSLTASELVPKCEQVNPLYDPVVLEFRQRLDKIRQLDLNDLDVLVLVVFRLRVLVCVQRHVNADDDQLRGFIGQAG